MTVTLERLTPAADMGPKADMVLAIMNDDQKLFDNAAKTFDAIIGLSKRAELQEANYVDPGSIPGKVGVGRSNSI